MTRPTLFVGLLALLLACGCAVTSGDTMGSGDTTPTSRPEMEGGVPRTPATSGETDELLGDTPFRFTLDRDHTLGPQDAPINLAIFSDFECPHCARSASSLLSVFHHFSGLVAVTFKHFPLGFHKEARPLARVAICAAEQGLFWKVHDQVFSMKGGALADDAQGIALDHGADETALQTCLLGDRPDQKIERDRNEGVLAAIRGTPTVYINGREFLHPRGPVPRVLVPVIERLLETRAR